MNHYQITRNKPARSVAGIFSLLTLLATLPQLSAQDQLEAREGEAKWQRDLVAFDKHLKTIAAAARTPTAEEFQARIKNGPAEEVEALGLSGFLDFRPPEDTVQFRVNDALKGKAVRWEIELADDPRDYGQVWLNPRWKAKTEAEPLAKDQQSMKVIMFLRNEATLPATKLARGQRFVVEGRIGDASNNRDFDSLRGPAAFYHPQGIPMFFWVGLDQVKITRLEPTEEKLRTHLLSGKASLERKAWKVLEVNGKAAFDEKLAGHAFDGDAYTAWHTGGQEGPKHPHSLLVDLGRVETVAGIRYLPPRAPRSTVDGAPEPRDGVIGSFSLYLSPSREEMGEPVEEGP